MKDETRREFIKKAFQVGGIAAIHAFGIAALKDARAFGILPAVVSSPGDNNYFGDGSDGALSTSGNVTHTVANKDGSYDGDMYVCNYSSLIINNGHTMTVDQPCKGLLVYVQGNCTIDGTLTMTARGALEDPTVAVSATGIRLPMLKTGETDTLSAADFAGCGSAAIAAVANQGAIAGNGKIYTIARAGAAGGAAKSNGTFDGNPGSAGGVGESGGGGGGSVEGTGSSGAGAAGICFSGGPGGGGCSGTPTAGSGVANGGAGGDGATTVKNATGGAGNPAGADQGGGPTQDGTGGLLLLVVGGDLTIGATGVVSANGKNGGDAVTGMGGGGSGGGNVLTLYAGTLTNNGSIAADGGAGGPGGTNGGAGGAGSVQTAQVDVA